MDLEQAVLGALSKSAGFCIADGRLELRSGSGEPLARFVPEQAEANEPK